MAEKQPPAPPAQGLTVAIGVPGAAGTVTARRAGELVDMQLPVSPAAVPVKQALENLAKAINLALQAHFLETPLDPVYKAARVRKGAVQVLHADYIGLGDGVFARIGKAARTLQLSFRGPDPASPDGKAAAAAAGGARPLRGLLDLLGRKLDLLQEFEDHVPAYVEQMLDRLEAARMITGWTRAEWDVTTSVVGLDIWLTPRPADAPPAID